MHGCAWLLLYALLLSCADACGLKVGMSPGPAFGRNTSQTIFPTGWPQGSDPGLTNALTAKPKEPCFSTGFTKHHCCVGLGFRRRLCRAQLHHRGRTMQSSFPSTDGASQVRCFSGTSLHRRLDSLRLCSWPPKI